jgi:hypothetical protein
MSITTPPYKFALALQGDVADLPSGSDYPEETLFWARDTTTLYINDGTTFNAVAGGAVSSVFGRTGAVVAVTDDYTDAEVQDSPTQILTATGDLLYASAANTLARLAAATDGDVLTLASGLPAWEPASGGAVAIITLDVFSETAAPAGGGVGTQLFLADSVPAGTPSTSGGFWAGMTTASIQTYLAGVIWTWTQFSADVDTTADDYDVSAKVLIQNEDGSESLSLSGAVSANAGAPGDTGTVGIGDLSAGATTGSDLSYDDTTGEVSSAAGGNYSVTVQVQGAWH